MNKRIECVISGWVQMVMYRDFVTRSARKLGLVGEVWNEKDGTVHTIAEGEEIALLQLVKKLHEGSLLSRVKHVDVLWFEPLSTCTTFSIRYE